MYVYLLALECNVLGCGPSFAVAQMACARFMKLVDLKTPATSDAFIKETWSMFGWLFDSVQRSALPMLDVIKSTSKNQSVEFEAIDGPDSDLCRAKRRAFNIKRFSTFDFQTFLDNDFTMFVKMVQFMGAIEFEFCM